jgi:hypothetical protein
MKDLITYGEHNFEASSLGKPLMGRMCYKLVLEHGYNTWPALAHGRVA